MPPCPIVFFCLSLLSAGLRPSTAWKTCTTGDVECYATIPPNACAMGGIPEVPKLKLAQKKRLRKFFKGHIPIVLRDAELVKSASHWTPSHMARNAKKMQTNNEYPDGVPNLLKVRKSPTKLFLFGDDKKDSANLPGWKFKSPVNHTFYTIDSFAEAFYDKNRDHHLYAMQVVAYFVLDKQMVQTAPWGPSLEGDMAKFKWDEPLALDREQFTSPGSRTLQAGMWMGEKGTVSPLHFDLSSGLLSQAVGAKCVLLIPNTDHNWKHTKVYPLHHPNNRQSQLPTAWSPEKQRFDVRLLPDGLQGVRVAHIAQGDTLYNPGMYYHAVASLQDNPSSRTEFGLSFAIRARGDTRSIQRKKNFNPIVVGSMECETLMLESQTPEEYGWIFLTLDESFHTDPQEWTEDMRHARDEVLQGCDEMFRAAITDEQTPEDVMEQMFKGRFIELSQGWDGEWSHTETMVEFLDRTWDGSDLELATSASYNIVTVVMAVVAALFVGIWFKMKGNGDAQKSKKKKKKPKFIQRRKTKNKKS